VHCVDLGESFPTSIYLQKSASIQPRTSPSKFGGKYSILFTGVLNQQPAPSSQERGREKGAPLRPARLVFSAFSRTATDCSPTSARKISYRDIYRSCCVFKGTLSRRYRGTSRRVAIFRAIGGVSVTHSSSSRADNRSLCARCSAALSSSPCLAKILRTMRQSHCFHIASTLQCGVVTYVNLICRIAHRIGIIR
jgi:hypothetical protein